MSKICTLYSFSFFFLGMPRIKGGHGKLNRTPVPHIKKGWDTRGQREDDPGPDAHLPTCVQEEPVHRRKHRVLMSMRSLYSLRRRHNRDILLARLAQSPPKKNEPTGPGIFISGLPGQREEFERVKIFVKEMLPNDAQPFHIFCVVIQRAEEQMIVSDRGKGVAFWNLTTNCEWPGWDLIDPDTITEEMDARIYRTLCMPAKAVNPHQNDEILWLGAKHDRCFSIRLEPSEDDSKEAPVHLTLEERKAYFAAILLFED
jgi:hypothetical protein